MGLMKWLGMDRCGIRHGLCEKNVKYVCMYGSSVGGAGVRHGLQQRHIGHVDCAEKKVKRVCMYGSSVGSSNMWHMGLMQWSGMDRCGI